jgi:hypothetical protein
VNIKRVARLYRLEELNLRIRKQKKLAPRLRVSPAPANAPNECWSIDFVADESYETAFCLSWSCSSPGLGPIARGFSMIELKIGRLELSTSWGDIDRGDDDEHENGVVAAHLAFLSGSRTLSRTLRTR